MKVRCLVACVFFIFSQTFLLFAGQFIEISGAQIPLIDGAQIDKDPPGFAARAQSVCYKVDKPLRDVESFYKTFFENNGFIMIGGPDADGGFSSAVKKERAQFYMRICKTGAFTLIQFIW